MKNGVINNVTPGVFFYFTRVTVGAGDTVKIDQTSSAVAPNTTPFLEFVIRDVSVYATPSCTRLGAIAACAGVKDCSFVIATAGGYIIRVRYDSMSVAGTDVCLPAPPAVSLPANHYKFTTLVNGGEIAKDEMDVKAKANTAC